jgi:hypothetical protein
MEARMAGEWFVEFYPEGANTPDSRIEFLGFPELLEHVQGFRATRAGRGILRVHLPASATDEDRRRLHDAGATPV